VIVGSEAEFANVTFVTPEFFQVFGVAPMLGRLFGDEELKRGGSTGVVVSHAFWQRHFGGNTLGQTVRVFEKAVPIVGVMPPVSHSHPIRPCARQTYGFQLIQFFSTVTSGTPGFSRWFHG
jgi:hypothetical protein